MKKVFIIIAVLYGVVFPQEFKKAGTSGFVFLELPVSAKSAGLGEASITLNDHGASGLFINPAATGFNKSSHSLSISYSPWIADINHYTTAYSYRSEMGVFSIGAIVMDYGSMKRTQKVGGQKLFEVIGTFNADALAFSFGYSKQLTDKFSFGVALKYVREKIDIYTADNIVFDAGVLYYTGLGSLRLAATIQNFGVDSKYLNDSFRMPAMFRIGLATEVLGDYESEYRVTAIAEAYHPSDNDERVNVGTEIAWKNMLILRGGYKFFYDEESFNFGVGINPGFDYPLQLDFAYSDYGRLGEVLRLSLQLGIL